MKRAPTTFSLMLGLLFLALALALAIAAILSIRASRRVTGETYGRLVAATAIATDELSRRTDPAAQHALAKLADLDVHIETSAPPASTALRIAPVVSDIGQTTGHELGDPSRVVVSQSSDSQIWVRSANDPTHWISLHALSYHRQMLRSTLMTTLIAGLIALAMASAAARVLTRPLEHLSANATALLAGVPMRDTLNGSPLEVRQLATAIGIAGEQQRHVARERELMLAGISHDLRTPLARLRLALELGDANDPQRCEAMVADLEELDNALEQCLSFVRDGRDEPLRDIDIATLAGQLLAAHARTDDWQLDGPAQLQAVVRPTLLRRAIGNLMDNAERHGAPPFRLSLTADHDALVIRVADHGLGVTPELLHRLGQPFLRGDHARTNAGSGLGLSIVKRAAELHGGNLWLEPRKANGRGLVATIRIPNALRRAPRAE